MPHWRQLAAWRGAAGRASAQPVPGRTGPWSWVSLPVPVTLRSWVRGPTGFRSGGSACGARLDAGGRPEPWRPPRARMAGWELARAQACRGRRARADVRRFGARQYWPSRGRRDMLTTVPQIKPRPAHWLPHRWMRGLGGGYEVVAPAPLRGRPRFWGQLRLLGSTRWATQHSGRPSAGSVLGAPARQGARPDRLRDERTSPVRGGKPGVLRRQGARPAAGRGIRRRHASRTSAHHACGTAT